MNSREKLFGSAPLINQQYSEQDEYRSIRNSRSMANEAIGVAETVIGNLVRQGETLSQADNRLLRMVQQAPIVGTLTKGIDIKRKKDRMVLGSLIGFLMFVIVWYLF